MVGNSLGKSPFPSPKYSPIFVTHQKTHHFRWRNRHFIWWKKIFTENGVKKGARKVSISSNSPTISPFLSPIFSPTSVIHLKCHHFRWKNRHFFFRKKDGLLPLDIWLRYLGTKWWKEELIGTYLFVERNSAAWKFFHLISFFSEGRP